MLKIGQNVIVEMPTGKLPGVIRDITFNGDRGEIYWVRAGKIRLAYQRSFPYPSFMVKPLIASDDDPYPEHFSVGSHVSLYGERWEILSLIDTPTETVYVVQSKSKFQKEVSSDDFR